MLLSVITINYNNAAGLRLTVASVLGQTFKDFEYLIVDGGSTDGSAEVVATRPTAWSCSERDGGIYDAMNKGVAHASGEYVVFLNSGDVFASADVLARVAESLDGTDIVYGSLTFRYPTKDFTRQYPAELSAAFFYKDTLPHPASFIRRELLTHTPYSTDYRIVSDWIFFMREIVVNNASYRRIDELITIFTVDGVSTNHTLEYAERERALNEHFSPMILAAINAQSRLQHLRRKFRFFCRKCQ